MSIQLENERSEHVFQMEPNLAHQLKEHKHKAKHICVSHMHQHVRVKTIHGEVYEGLIVHIDEKHIYLSVQHAPVSSRPAYPPVYGPYSPYSPYGPGLVPGLGPYGPGPYGLNPYASTILPLALFDLLAIALIV